PQSLGAGSGLTDAMTPEGAESLPFDALQRIDRACTSFERAWRGGQRPDLRDFLAGWGAERSAVLCELLKVELECRRKRGEQPAAEEYRRRFPGDEGPIAAAFAAVRHEPPRPDEARGKRLTVPADMPPLRPAAVALPTP